MATKNNSLEALRAKLNKQKEDSSKKKDLSGDTISTSDITPGAEGKIKLRLLPPINEEDVFFYRTHSYNYLQGLGDNGTDLMFHSKKQLRDSNDKFVKNPIDVLVADIYKSDDKDLISKIASPSKRKRKFYCNALILEEGKPSRYITFVDATNRGEVMKKICELMDIPFARDTEDGWFEDVVAADEPVDLLSIEDGYDFTITKVKNGKDNWDVEYKVTPSRNSRALTKDEKKLLASRVDLENLIKYEDSLEVVKDMLRKLTGDEEIEVKSNSKKGTPKKQTDLDEVSEEDLDEELSDVEETENEDDDTIEEDEEEVMNLLEDDDSEEEEVKTPKKKAVTPKKKVASKKKK